MDEILTSSYDSDRQFLSSIAAKVSQSEELQNSLAIEFLANQIIPKLCSAATLIIESSNPNNNVSESEKSDQLSIYLLSLQTMVLFCRREVLQKGSASLPNIALLSENISQIFTSSTSLITSMNALVAYLFCALVMVLASDSDERQKQLLGLNVHNTIIKTLQNYLPTRNLIVCEMGLRALRNIAAHDESAGELVKSGICELIVEVIRVGLELSHEKREIDYSNSSNIVVADSIKDYVVLSIRPVSSLELLEAALWATVNLSFDADASASLGAVGISRLLLDIWDIASEDILLSNGAAASGEVKRIDVSLARNLERLRILNAIASVLRNLSYASLNFASFEDTSVCEALISLIASFSYTARADGDDDDDAMEREILSTAIWGVVNLSCSAKLGPRFVRLNAVELILDSVKRNQLRFAEERCDSLLGPIAEAAIFAIRNLANTLAPSDTKTAEGGNTEQQQEGEKDEEAAVTGDLLSHFGDGAACRFLFDMLTRYVSREGMVEACCGAVSALCGGDGSLCSIMAVQEGAFPKLFAAVKEHTEVVETVEACLRSLIYLLQGQRADCVSEFLGSGGMKFVVECMDGHRRDYDVVKFCCELLLHTRYTDADTRKALSDGGQIRVLPSKGDSGAHPPDPPPPVVYYATPAGNFLDIYAAWMIESIKSELNMT